MQENIQALPQGAPGSAVGSVAVARASRYGRMLTFARSDTCVVVLFAVVQNLMRAASGMILTRLLVPEVFGITGIIASIAFTASMISDLGFQAFTVRHEKGDTPRMLDTVWTIALVRSALVTASLLALAGPIASALGKHEVAPMIRFAALGFLIEGAASMTLMTAVRKRMIMRLSLLELGVMVVQLAVSVVLAVLWRDVWSVLVAMLVSSAVKTLASYIVFPDARRRLAFDPAYARELWHFARYITGSSILTLLLAQSDKLVLARVMPLDRFGLYILAVNLASAPMAFVNPYTTRVLYPVYAELWRSGAGDLRAQFYTRRWKPSCLYSIAAGGLIGCAPFVVKLLYDPRYEEAGLYLQLLAITPFLALASASAHETLTAAGRVSANFHAGIAKVLWLALALPLAYATVGTIGLVAAVGLLEVPALLLRWTTMARLGLLDLPRELVLIALGLGGMAAGMAGSALLSTGPIGAFLAI